MKNEIAYLMQLANKKISNLKLTPTIDSVMESKKQRFALAIVAVSFGRKKVIASSKLQKVLELEH